MFPTFCLLHAVTSEYRDRKRRNGKCITWRCRRKARADGARCDTCHCRLHRLRHPDHYAFVALKASARKRRIAFELTFDQFKQFIAGSGYLSDKGREPHSLTIDRINRLLPYRLDNLRFLSHADNSSHRYEETEPNPF